MTNFNFDKQAWQKRLWDMPYSRPGGKTAQDAMTKPGNCLKSIEREHAGGFPKHHGRLLQHDVEKDEVVVLSHNDGIDDNPFVWTGTVIEYQRTWDCD